MSKNNNPEGACTRPGIFLLIFAVQSLQVYLEIKAVMPTISPIPTVTMLGEAAGIGGA